jgi:hypothetical protein
LRTDEEERAAERRSALVEAASGFEPENNGFDGNKPTGHKPVPTEMLAFSFSPVGGR